eukprot:TRINITY_DN1644_c0_g1_i3.p2 TRINITY_DN1644_c0_g1~~TRINITY_DN1644_c0_g1_i3.p2  ORF type:complete len:169 (+),score=31.15 TRINITY_DN1644_c0_g1_i3:136-642(+)
MIRRPPRSTLSSSSAASDVYKRQVSTQSTGENPLIRMPKADPEPKSAAGGGINWKRQGIILAISIGIAFYMVGRTPNTGPGKNGAPVETTEALRKEVQKTINMRMYEVVEGQNQRGDPKFLVVKNTENPPIVAAEFIYSPIRRGYTGNYFDDELSHLKARLQEARIVL